MTIQLSQKNYSLGLLFSVSIASFFGLFINETADSGIMLFVYNGMLYISFLFSILLLGQIFKTKVHFLVIIFFICSLIPIMNYDSSSGLIFKERYRWLFYTAAILSANVENVRIWIKILIVMMSLYCVSPILFEPIFFPDSNVNSGWDFEIERFFHVMVFGGLFLFGIQKKLSVKQNMILYISTIIALLILVYFARRTMSVVVLLFFFTPIFSSVESISSKIKKWVLVSIMLFSIVYVVVSSIEPHLFERLFERIDEDSRSEVDFFTLSAIEQGDGWITGIGLHGGYHNPMEHENLDLRNSVETGVLDVIMDGGVLLWLSMMIMAIYAFYLGQFRSNNSLVKSFSFVILVFILMQYPLQQPGVDMRGFMIFTSIGFCLNPLYREYTDDEIFNLIFNKK